MRGSKRVMRLHHERPSLVPTQFTIRATGRMPASTAGRLRKLPPTGLRNPLSRTAKWVGNWVGLPPSFSGSKLFRYPSHPLTLWVDNQINWRIRQADTARR